MSVHQLHPSSATLAGHFDPAAAAVLTVASGDTVVTATVDAGWHQADQPEDVLAGRRPPLPRPDHDPVRDPGHALIGPIAVQGALPGMVVEVRVVDVRPGSWGWTAVGGSSTWVNDRCGLSAERELLVWRIDQAAATATDQHGDTVGLRPFLGVVGCAPADPAQRSTIPPRSVGGNLDCRELVAGSSLFLPVEVPGALVWLGDGHAVQGDGEVSGTALECPMERVEVQLVLHPHLRLTTPRATTPAGEIVLGTGTTVDEATLVAITGMVDLLAGRSGIARPRALALCSVAVDLRVTQVVNGGVFGVHAVLPPGRLDVGAPGPGPAAGAGAP